MLLNVDKIDPNNSKEYNIEIQHPSIKTFSIHSKNFETFTAWIDVIRIRNKDSRLHGGIIIDDVYGYIQVFARPSGSSRNYI